MSLNIFFSEPVFPEDDNVQARGYKDYVKQRRGKKEKDEEVGERRKELQLSCGSAR